MQNLKYGDVWRRVLLDEEEVVYEFTLGGQWRLVNTWIIGLLGLLLLGIPTLIALFYYLFYVPRAYNYAFTDRRLLIKRGWLSTTLKTVDYDKITDYQVREGFLDRVIYNTGTLAINTAGTAGMEIVLRKVEDPYELKRRLDRISSGGETEAPPEQA